MFKINWQRVRAEKFHRFLPDDVRDSLKGRGIPATLIERKLLGWDGQRITIPIFGREPEEILGFSYATIPADPSGRPETVAEPGAKPELYGWETLAQKPRRVVISEHEFDRLVLEAHGFAAVTSTAGAETFLEAWAPFFEGIRHIYVCFGRRATQSRAAKRLQSVLPSARIVTLPADAADVTDFFVRLRRTRVDLEVLLASAAVAEGDDTDDEPPVPIRPVRPYQKKLQRRAEALKRAVPLHEIVTRYRNLRAEGGRLLGHCPFCNAQEPSFSVYPKMNVYYCATCEAQGDVLQFLMNKESITYREALEALERFDFTRELF